MARPGHPQGIHDQRQDVDRLPRRHRDQSTVLYPTAGLAFNMIRIRPWAVPLAPAYNDWFTDKFHQGEPQRLARVALVPIQDVPEAVKELRRAVTESAWWRGARRERRGARVRKPARRSFVLAAV